MSFESLITPTCVLILCFSSVSHYRTTHTNPSWQPQPNIQTGVKSDRGCDVTKKQNSTELSVPGAQGTQVLPSYSNKPMVVNNAPSLCWGGITAGTWRTVFAWMPAVALVTAAVCREIWAHCSYRMCCTVPVYCTAFKIWWLLATFRYDNVQFQCIVLRLTFGGYWPHLDTIMCSFSALYCG